MTKYYTPVSQLSADEAEKRRAKQRAYYKKNKVKILAKAKAKTAKRAKAKERRKEWCKEYFSRPEVRAKIKEYRSRPEVKEKRKQYSKEYNSRPEVKAKKREYAKAYYCRKKAENASSPVLSELSRKLNQALSKTSYWKKRADTLREKTNEEKAKTAGLNSAYSRLLDAANALVKAIMALK